jgi:hypothetical protein
MWRSASSKNQGTPSPLIADFPVPENAPFRVVEVLVPTLEGFFPCTGSNLEIGADLIPDFLAFLAIGNQGLTRAK